MNKEKLRGLLEKIKTTLGKVSKKIWTLILICLVVVAAVIVLIVHNYNNRPYAVLIDRANNEEMATVQTWLQEQGITDYKVEGTGTILVPENQAVTLKARLLQQQYSSSGAAPSGYFEQVGALSTQYDRRIAWQLDLQDRLARTIRQFPGVLSATVEISLGDDNSYVLYENNVVDATAAVIVTMEQGKMLDNGQVAAIRNYVSHGVPDLDVENVSVSDTIGNTYSDFSSGGNANSDSLLKLQLEQEWSNRIRTQIVGVLEDAYGKGNVKAAVNVSVELGRKTVNTHDVTLPEFAQDGSTGGRGILGSEFYAYQFTTPDGGAAGGVVGTSTNADLPTNVEPGEAQAELENILNEEANRIYDNPTTDTEMIIHCGTITDVTAAVTINNRDVTAEGGTVDIPTVRQHAAMAAGIIPVVTEDMTADEYWETRISVLATPFPEEETPVEPDPGTSGTVWGIPYWVFIAAGVGVILFVLVLTLILVLRRKKRKKQEAEQKAMEELLATAMPGKAIEIGEDGQPIIVDAPPEVDKDGNPVAGANVMDLHTEQSMELRQNIRDFVDENMEVAALLLKSWMKEGGDNG